MIWTCWMQRWLWLDQICYNDRHKKGQRDRHSFNGLFSSTTWVSWQQKVWILMKQETMRWQWRQLDHMQIISNSLQTDNHASTSSLNFLQAGCSSLPNQQCQGIITICNIETFHCWLDELLTSHKVAFDNLPNHTHHTFNWQTSF